MDVRLTGHGLEEFATPRLVGRRLRPADMDFLTELHQDTEVMALHGGPRTRASTEPFARSNVAHWRHFQFGLYILAMASEPDVPIGRVGMRWDNSLGAGVAVDASVLVVKHMWGQGIGSESLRAITSMGLDRQLPLVASCQAGHAAARRVLEKVGFVYWTEFQRNKAAWVRYSWPAERQAPAEMATRLAD